MKLVILGGKESGTGAALLGQKLGYDVFLSDKGVMSRGSQWTKLNTALKGGVQKNVIVLLDSTPGFVESLDKSAFENIEKSC